MDKISYWRSLKSSFLFSHRKKAIRLKRLSITGA